MKIIAIEKERPNASKDEFKARAAAEARKVWELQQDNFIRECYFRTDENSAVLILESESVSAAEIRLKELPYVDADLIQFELIPLKAYAGFSRLFRKD